MTTSTRPPHDDLPSSAPPPDEHRGWASATVVLTVVVTALVVLAIAVLANRPGAAPSPAPVLPPTAGPATPAPTAPPTSAPAQTTTAPPAATTTQPAPTTTAAPTTPPAPADAVTAVWPAAQSPTRYATPEGAVRGFATGLAGFREPLLGPYQAGDANSGEIEVRPQDAGPITTVFVRRFGDGTWWVLGSATTDVRLDSPSTGETVSSRMTLSGEARAFEGHVTVRIMQDRSARPLTTGFVTGGGDVPRRFTGTFAFAAPSSGYGSIVLTTESARDGRVWSASVQRVRFATGR